MIVLNIPDSFKNNGEDYITLPVIYNFIKTHKIDTKGIHKRIDFMEKILEFGKENEENASVVLNWIDDTIQEGIKDIYLKYTPLSDEISVLCSKKDKLTEYLECHISKHFNKHFCQNEYTKEFALINASVQHSELGDKILFFFCKKLYSYDSKKKLVKPIIYPVIAEYYIDGNWLIVKAKPKSNLYIYSEENFDIEKNDSTTTEKEVYDVMGRVSSILQMLEVDKLSAGVMLRKKIFCLLDKYTMTPSEIETVISVEDETITEMTQRVINICTIKEKCQVPQLAHKDIEDDIRNLVEKYLSINWTDKDIFIKDRDAYPVKLSATDEEESKVEQTAGAWEPLQTKALFFDNKKMLYKNKSCDGIVLKWKRISPMSRREEFFNVRIAMNLKGLCIFKFAEYTAKEDIENVIFSIIKAKGDN